MIRSIRVRNYKCYADFRLADVNKHFVLISGDNNVGKTNLLEAIFLFHDRQNPMMTTRHWAFRGVPVIPTDARHLVASLFHDLDTKNAITLEVERDGHEKEALELFVPARDEIVSVTPTPGPGLENKAPLSFPVGSSVSMGIKLSHGGDTILGELSFSPMPDGLLRRQLQFKREPPDVESAIFVGLRSPGDLGEEAARFGEVDKMNRVEELVAAMQPLAPGLRDISVIPMGGANVLHGDMGTGEKTPLRLLGDGVVRTLQYLLAIQCAKVALFDEVDSGLHYSVKSKVFRTLAQAARNRDCQIFCTTHSYECLEKVIEGLRDGFEHDFCYIRLDRSADRIVPKNYSYDALAAAIENRWEIR